MDKIMFLSPPIYYMSNPLFFRFPAHILYLMSYLEAHGYPSKFFDLSLEIGTPLEPKTTGRYLKKAKELLSKVEYDVVCISCRCSAQYLPTMDLASICKELNPVCRVIVGGYHPSACSLDFAYPKSPVDFVVKGEGEAPLLNIIQNISKSDSAHIPKISRLHYLKELKDLPLLNLEPIRKYEARYTGFSEFMSRSCPYDCYFCMGRVKGDLPWRAFPPKMAVERLKKEWDSVKSEKIKETRLYLDDPTFGLNRVWRKKFLEELVNENLDVNLIQCETRVDILTRDDIRLFKKAKFLVSLGIESGSPEMLRAMNKTTNPSRFLERAKKVANYCKDFNCMWAGYWLFGFPGEDESTLEKTLSLIQTVYDGNFSGSCRPGAFALYPGTYVWDHMNEFEVKYGARFSRQCWWKDRSRVYNRIYLNELTTQPSSSLSLERFTEIMDTRVTPLVNAINEQNNHPSIIWPDITLVS